MSDSHPIPPASFELLVTSLAAQAMIAMGQFPDPSGEEHEVNFELAQHHIDLLGVLETKSQGNLTPDEASLLENALHQVRMLFVHVKQNPKH